MIEIPTDIDYEVDKTHWGKMFDPDEPTHHDSHIINGWIAMRTICYRNRPQYKGEDLWQLFHEDFEGFTFDIFKLAHRSAVKELRCYMVLNGVWVDGPRGATSYAKTLQQCLDESTPTKWTDDMLKEKQKLMSLQPTAQPQPSSHNPSSHNPSSYNPSSYNSTHPQAQTPSLANGSQDTAPLATKLLTDLLKLYYNDDKKYGGEEYDVLDSKLQIFYDYCNKIGLDQYHHAYSIMLKGRASEFYYDKIFGRSYDFSTMCTMTRAHFETEEARQKYLSEWREATLLRTIAKNPAKSRLECLQLTIDKLQKV
jgi:hypothetical protein